MGQISSYLWPVDTGRNDDPDPMTGLTSRERYFIRITWEKLTENQPKCLETGILIFMSLFKNNPQYQKLFPFRDVPMDDLPSNNRFKAHCISVVFALTSLVNNIDQPELLEALLIKQGSAHVPRGVPKGAYQDLKKALTDIFKTILTKEELDAWDKFLTLGVEIMLKGAQSAQD